MRKTNGFTLIELIVVIVILGVLAVTAAPRFLNLQTDAKNSALLGLKGAIESAMEVSYGKLALEGLESKDAVFFDPKLEDWCEKCWFTYGYPANNSTTFTYLVNDVTPNPNEDADWFIGRHPSNDKEHSSLIIFSFPEYFDSRSTINRDNCYLQYKAPGPDTDPVTKQPTPHKLEMIPCE